MSEDCKAKILRKLCVVGALCLLLSCGGGTNSTDATQASDLCNCTPTSPASVDFRHDQKHVPLPSGQPQEITIATMLGWPVDPNLLQPNAPRQGRELQLFHLSTAFLQRVKLEPFDCDVHFEISADSGKTSPRVIVELPVDAEYCIWRRSIQQQLAARGVTITNIPVELSPPLPLDVRGLAFQDAPHATRGTDLVATVWELHPAIVQLK